MLRYCVLLLFSFMLAIGVQVQGQTCTATLETVARQVGESVVFCGKVEQVHASSKPDGPVHLDFGGAYPDNTFGVVIFADVAGDDREKLAQRFNGKEVRVSGTVQEYKGKPEIVLKDLKEIEEE